MMLRRILFVSALMVLICEPANAGIFSRKPKPTAERVPELLVQLKAGTDESQRTEAAGELRQFDPKSNPEIVNGLIDALGKDASVGVRAEAAASLGKLRPISQQIGYALEQAQNNDGAMRVRLAARQALLQYHLVGYRSSGKSDSSADKNGTQPVSGTNPPVGPLGQVKSPQNPTRIVMTPQGPFRETAEPPLADPPVLPKSAPIAVPVSRPKGPPPVQLAPLPEPKLQPIPGASWTPAPSTKPGSIPDLSGPALPPPS